MSELEKLLLNGLAINSSLPSKGGLRLADYPNPYGLRYGENAIPKSYGWLGVHKGIDGDMTEYSMSDDRGFEYPSFVPNTSKENIELLKKGIISKQQSILAKKFADDMLIQGKSPFFDPFLDALKALPK